MSIWFLSSGYFVCVVDYCGGGGSLGFRSEIVLVLLKLFRLLGVFAGGVSILRDLLFSFGTFAYRLESILVIFFLFSNFICFLALGFLGVRVLVSPDDCEVFIAEFYCVRFFGVAWRP